MGCGNEAAEDGVFITYLGGICVLVSRFFTFPSLANALIRLGLHPSDCSFSPIQKQIIHHIEAERR
jgi:hypothetical protein